MEKLLEKFIRENYREVLRSNKIKRLESTAELNNEKLKENFNKEQKALLLRIVDTKNLIAEECGYKCFIAGFKLGVKIGYETNKD